MHRSQHACNKFVNAIAFLHQRYQRRDPTLIIVPIAEACENQFLESLNLILQSHQIGDGLVAGETLVHQIKTLQVRCHTPHLDH